MKKIRLFWGRRSNYEKAAIGMAAAVVLFCGVYFSAGLYYGSECAICTQTLTKGEHYILDVRTGELLPIARYVNDNRDILWFSSISREPQEVSGIRKRGYMRFPRQASKTAHYCLAHTVYLGSNFLVLSPAEGAAVCYRLLPGQNLDPEGRVIDLYLNEALNCWEIEIQWGLKTSVSSS